VCSAGRTGYFAGHPDFIKDIQHDLHRLRVIAFCEAPHWLDLDPDQSYISIQ
jgi:hypothetical protein